MHSIEKILKISVGNWRPKMIFYHNLSCFLFNLTIPINAKFLSKLTSFNKNSEFFQIVTREVLCCDLRKKIISHTQNVIT